MTLKIDWDSKNKEFYVKVGTGGGRRMIAKTSREMSKKLLDIGVNPNVWKWTRSAKKQIEKEG